MLEQAWVLVPLVFAVGSLAMYGFAKSVAKSARRRAERCVRRAVQFVRLINGLLAELKTAVHNAKEIMSEVKDAQKVFDRRTKRASKKPVRKCRTRSSPTEMSK